MFIGNEVRSDLHQPREILALAPNPRAFRLIWGLAWFTVLLVAASLPALGGNDCEKAKELYQEGAKLLNFSERKDAFKKAVVLCPTYAEAHVNLADACENLNEYEDAEKHYSEAIKQGLNSFIPYLGLGEVYLKTGRYHLAIEAYRKGKDLAPDNDRIAGGLNVASERIGREKRLYTQAEIQSCLLEDEAFRLMCMCPIDHYSVLRKMICMPAIKFGSGSDQLSVFAADQLDEVGRAMNTPRVSDMAWLVIGHADIVGTESRNKKLAQRRAEKVKRYLVEKHKIDPSKLKVLSLGSTRPRSENNSTEGRADNRRVEVVLIGE